MKKKNYLLGMIATGMLLFTACSNDEDITNGNGNKNATQSFVLQVASSGDGISTRAGRPLLSSEAKQTIENVKIIICDGSTVKYAKDIADWNTTGSKEYTTGGHGRETTIEIPTANKLAAGTYTVYAFGYSNNSDYDLTTITDIANGATSGTFNADTKLGFKSGATNTVGEEIFAGSYALTVVEGEGFKKPVVLNRQVAGTFGYVKEIPYIAGAAKLRLVAADRNKELVLGQFANFDLTGNGTGNGANVKYVINGTTTNADSKVIYEIKLADWFTKIEDANSDGLIDAANWKAPASYTDYKFKNGSVFAGEFLIPFAKKGTDQTFKLELMKEDGSVLRSWNVNLPAADGQMKEHDLYTWGSNFTSAKNTDTKNCYNVVRNHLYGIGQRALDTTDPTDPNPGNPDEPESLNNKQELTLRVNDNWEVIHKMDIE